MAYKDFPAFVKALEGAGELTRVTAPVSCELEISEITDRVCKRYGKALLFENVRGYDVPVVTNAFGSYRRMAMALGVERLDDLSREIARFLDMASYTRIGGIVKSLPRLRRLAGIFSLKLPIRGACQQVIEHEPDLTKLPILKCWPQDGGRFITLPVVITKDPETGIQNAGMYRMQLYDKNTTGMHWHLHKDGREIYEAYARMGGRMPVSVVIGCDPCVMYAATAPLPKMIDEIVFAGFLRKSPVHLVKCVTNDLYVPADSEIVIEGYVDVNEPLRTEGPFGDHTGYYSLADEYPTFHATCVTRKQSPIYPATIVGKPPMEDCYMGKATERIFLPMLQLTCPEIVDICFPLEGVFHGCVIVSMRKRYPLHAQKVMYALWGMGQMMYTKMIVAVDADVSPHDLSTVAWKVFNNIDPRRDITITNGPLDALDHASPTALYGSRIGIDATKKLPQEHSREWPDDIAMDIDIQRLVSEKWQSYGID